MLNKDRVFFQYNNRDLMYIISLLISQLHIASRKVIIKYVGLVVVYKIIDPHNYSIITLDGKISRGLFEHERLKSVMLRMSEGNIKNLSHLKQVINMGLLAIL